MPFNRKRKKDVLEQGRVVKHFCIQHFRAGPHRVQQRLHQIQNPCHKRQMDDPVFLFIHLDSTH